MNESILTRFFEKILVKCAPGMAQGKDSARSREMVRISNYSIRATMQCCRGQEFIQVRCIEKAN
jgi:hypothetical protein